MSTAVERVPAVSRDDYTSICRRGMPSHGVHLRAPRDQTPNAGGPFQALCASFVEAYNHHD